MRVEKWTTLQNAIVHLPSSKSISNRLLIIQALSKIPFELNNLSEAKDTKDLISCLHDENLHIHVGDGGTTFRFLLAYFFISQKEKVISASGALSRRPHKILFETLENLGAYFEYGGENKYSLPVHHIPRSIRQDIREIEVDASLSSQFITAIMLIAPYLKHGLHIKLKNTIVSSPYITMTTNLMRQSNIILHQYKNDIKIEPGNYKRDTYDIEADWSAAAFFYCLLGLAPSGEIFFPNLKISGLQADEKINVIMSEFGIESLSKPLGVLIQKNEHNKCDEIEIDFIDCPDLFPAFSVFCAIKKCNLKSRNVQHLEHKESNRLNQIVRVLEQCNCKCEILREDNSISLYSNNSNFILANLIFDPVEDHRLAMAYSLFSYVAAVDITDIEVVNKSFPGYWDELKTLGIIFHS